MKQFSIFCNEKSIVIEYPSQNQDYTPKSTITFNKIEENLTLGYISWLSVIITIIIFGTLIFVSARNGLDSPFCLAVVTFSLIGALKLVNAFEKMIRIHFTKDGRAASRIHSAIHKAINAMIIEDTLTPDIDAIRKASCLNSNCETVYTLESILLGFFSIPIVLLAHKRLFLCIILLFLLRCVIENLLDRGVFNFMQIFILRKPTEEEISAVADLLMKSNELYKYSQHNIPYSEKDNE